MQSGWLSLLPFIILAAGGTVVFGAGAFRRTRPTGLLFGLAFSACLASGAAALFSNGGRTDLSHILALDGFSRFYFLIFAAITVIALLFSHDYAKARDFAGDEFLGLMLFAAAGMGIIASAVNWLLFFLGLELLSIALYVLIAIRRTNTLAIEAAIKYFIMGAAASAFLVFGIAMLYAATGTLSMQQSLAIAVHPENRFILLLGAALILVGLGFKVSLVPFHLWTPDVYQGSPAPVAAFLATGSKVALFAALVRLAVYAADGVGSALFPALWAMAALTMATGNITALVQTRVKRLLAYSSIAQMGYLLMALLAVKQHGAAAVIFYSALYAVMDLGAFGAVSILSPENADRDQIEDYRGLGHTNPGAAALLTVSLFSLAGLPATAGFIGKFVLFRAAFSADYTVLALIGILTAMVSMYFYLKVVVVLYMQPAGGGPDVSSCGPAARLACVLVTVILFWLGLFPAPALDLIARIAGSGTLPI